MTELKDKIKECIIRDYFTPNIQAEVILDALLTPYIAEIVKEQAGNLRGGNGWSFTGELSLIAKEMSIMELEDEGSENKNLQDKNLKTDSENRNTGPKIDYVLGDEETVYLVELKTTDSSIGGTQAERYLKNCRGKTFGEVFGNRLLSIMRNAFRETYNKKFDEKISLESSDDSEKLQGDEALKEAFWLIFDNDVFKNFHNTSTFDRDEFSRENVETDRKYAETARELIRKARWTQSRKYLYTAGQILDYLAKYKHPGRTERTLWNKSVRLIYLIPDGNKCPSKKLEEAKDFYIGSCSLMKACKYLETKQDDELARLLSDIIKYVYNFKERAE